MVVLISENQVNPRMKPSVVSSSEAGGEATSAAAHDVCSSDDLLSMILSKLPLISLRLFKSVCKRWLNLITGDPVLTTLRSRTANADDHPRGLILRIETSYSNFAYVPLVANETKRRPLITTTSFPFCPISDCIEVMQSCNGILLCRDPPDKFYVYNPTINRYKLLPLPSHIWSPCPYGFLRYMALAFDPTVSPHYKVVYAKEDNSWPRQVHVEIYSSETGNWSLCAQTFSLFSFAKFDESVVYWRGALHWMSCDHVYHFTLEDTENPHFIQVEDHRTLYGQSYERRDKLFVSRDCLLLVRMLQLLQMNVHEMNADYSGWSVKYHVNLESAAAAAAAAASLSFPQGFQFESSCESGVFSKLTNAYCLVAIGASEIFYSTSDSELADAIPVVKTSIDGTGIIGQFCILKDRRSFCNLNYMLLTLIHSKLSCVVFGDDHVSSDKYQKVSIVWRNAYTEMAAVLVSSTKYALLQSLLTNLTYKLPLGLHFRPNNTGVKVICCVDCVLSKLLHIWSWTLLVTYMASSNWSE
ncbi:hypothetical protein SSX86_027676 [Deinandra increscens subsp. villosa]|uniref:F-box domain-containing protein n=1 Tax=Deinandra increscens subsp. villosa TaxID=3103831 RepID=A0AAP0C7X5_9ASTR